MKLSDLFNITYPKTLVFADMTYDKNGINFVSSQEKNNGVVGKVKREDGIEVYPSGCITVPLKGSVLMAHLQSEACYVAHQIGVLTEKKYMSEAEKLYYVTCIRSHAFKYNYGRQADRTLGDLEVPEINEEIISNLNTKKITTSVQTHHIPLNISKWEPFQLNELFRIEKGKRLTQEDMEIGNLNFLGAISSNNGVRDHISSDFYWQGNCITVNYNGSVGEAFYQRDPFWASDDVNILYPRDFSLNKYIGMFICTIIKQERYRYSYGRKWKKEVMETSIIKLPAIDADTPDWNWMEKYVKNLPFSDRI